MKNVGLSVTRCCALAGCVGGAALAQMPPPPTLSLKAVRINPFCVGGADAGKLCRGDDECASGACGVTIQPTSDVSIEPGDVLACDLFISSWSLQGQRLTAFQVEVDPSGFTSGPCGRVGVYDAPRACDSDSDCNDLNVDCTPARQCDETNPDSIFIDVEREDYVYLGRGGLAVPNTRETRWGGIVLNSANAPLYEPPPKYAGTLRLAAGDDASGRFTISFVPPAVNVLATSLTDTNNRQIVPLELEPLIVNVVAAVCAAPDPPNCSIEVRQFAEPDLSSPGPVVHSQEACAA